MEVFVSVIWSVTTAMVDLMRHAHATVVETIPTVGKTQVAAAPLDNALLARDVEIVKMHACQKVVTTALAGGVEICIDPTQMCAAHRISIAFAVLLEWYVLVVTMSNVSHMRTLLTIMISAWIVSRAKRIKVREVRRADCPRLRVALRVLTDKCALDAERKRSCSTAARVCEL